MSGWLEQYRRMHRWQRRLWLGFEHIAGGDDEATRDVFYAFAQASWHLVDWLEADRSQHVRRDQAEAYVHSSSILKFCRDICNGSKHAQLQAKKIDVTTHKTTTTVSGKDDEGESYSYEVANVQVLVRWGDEMIEASEFAGKCIEEWNRFLISEGLLSAPRET